MHLALACEYAPIEAIIPCALQNPVPTLPPKDLAARYRGALLGLACGDATGTALEFRPRGTFAPIADMVGGGPFGLAAGQWTDDTSMALCLAESLLTKNGFDAAHQMGLYTNWWQWGYLSATGSCFDIGLTVRDALTRFMQTGEPYAGSSDPRSAGNGSLMRLAPVVLFYYPARDEALSYCAKSSRTTHAAPEAIECCTLLGTILCNALDGLPKEQILDAGELALDEPRVQALARGAYLERAEEAIFGSGYAVHSLEAALWCFARTSDFRSAVLKAANLGDDADTTAAIVGQIAGAYYGDAGIPPDWLGKLYMGPVIAEMASALLDAAQRRAQPGPVGVAGGEH